MPSTQSPRFNTSSSLPPACLQPASSRLQPCFWVAWERVGASRSLQDSRSLQEPPGASRSLQQPPEAPRSLQEPPEASRSLQEPPGGPRSPQEPPEASRSFQKPPGASRSLASRSLQPASSFASGCLGACRSFQKPPGLQKPPGASRLVYQTPVWRRTSSRAPKPPGASRSLQKPPAASRSPQEPPEVSRSLQDEQWKELSKPRRSLDTTFGSIGVRQHKELK